MIYSLNISDTFHFTVVPIPESEKVDCVSARMSMNRWDTTSSSIVCSTLDTNNPYVVPNDQYCTCATPTEMRRKQKAPYLSRGLTAALIMLCIKPFIELNLIYAD